MRGLGRFGEGYGVDLDLESATIAGAIAGPLVLAGILTTDEIQLVQNVAAAGVNLASEFTITADGEIDNTGGTATTGMVLLVVWQRSVVNNNPLGV